MTPEVLADVVFVDEQDASPSPAKRMSDEIPKVARRLARPGFDDADCRRFIT
jgi:hypothetical protein